MIDSVMSQKVVAITESVPERLFALLWGDKFGNLLRENREVGFNEIMCQPKYHARVRYHQHEWHDL
jgi:hypothetical protein